MSAQTTTSTSVRGIPFSRLTLVELRKQVDTRAGAWLLGIIALVNSALIALVLFTAEPEALSWYELTNLSTIGQALLLPLIGIMAATSEWSQRTALTTFALEPRRTRVNAAKLVSAWVLGFAVTALTLFVAALLNVAGQIWFDGNGSWAMEWSVLAGVLLALLVFVSQGVAFGLALLSTPIAIVAYLALPTVWSILTMLVSDLHESAQWLDLNVTVGPLLAGTMTGEAWARLAVSVAVWVGVPMALGLWRTARREVS